MLKKWRPEPTLKNGANPESHTSRSQNYVAMKTLVLATLTIFCFCLFSCNDDLTRDGAKEEILKKYTFPYTESNGFETIIDKNLSFIKGDRYINKYEKLKAAGMISIRQCPCMFSLYYCAEFTNEAKQYILGPEKKDKYGHVCSGVVPVKVAEVEFGEVTGIQQFEQYNSAEVTYTIRRKNITPFGELLLDLKEEGQQRKIKFSKYDDGWRLQE